MTSDRKSIPAEIERQIKVEAGHRCVIQTCQNSANVDIHHIIPWEKCKEHDPKNLILLCPNCHRLAHDGKIDNKSLYKYKEICQKLTNPPVRHGDKEVKAYIKFDPHNVTRILDSHNVIALCDHGVLDFAIIFEKSFEDKTYIVHAMGDGSVNFKVVKKRVDSMQIVFDVPCPKIVLLEFKY